MGQGRHQQRTHLLGFEERQHPPVPDHLPRPSHHAVAVLPGVVRVAASAAAVFQADGLDVGLHAILIDAERVKEWPLEKNVEGVPAQDRVGLLLGLF